MLDVITDNLDLWTTAQKQKKAVGRGKAKKEEGYGIKKLRELILELAVRGKLVPQDVDDEPASVLLERIEPKKEQILKDGKFKSSDKKTVVDNSELFSIPENWQWCHLEDIAAIARGGSPRPIASFITDLEDGLNWIKIGDTDRSSRYVTKTEQKIRKEGLIKTRMVYPGDLILSNSMSFGFPYILKIKGCIHDGWLVIRPPEGMLDKMYLCNLFLSIHAKTSFENAASGAVVQNLNADKVRKLTVPLPPLAEQHRIVAKVDELMALCDQLEQQQGDQIATHQTLVETLLNRLILRPFDKLTAQDERGYSNQPERDYSVRPELVEGYASTVRQAHGSAQTGFEPVWSIIAQHFDTLFTTEHSIDQLKQTILQLAVMGKLVPQDPNDEPASVLLEKIAQEKAQLIEEGKIKKQKALPDIGEDEKPFELPDGWEWVRFGVVIKSFTNGLYKKASFYTDSGVISLRMYNIQDGNIEFSDVRRVNVTKNELSQYSLEAGDLLINRVNSKELVGKTALVPEYSEPLLFESMNMRAKSYTKYLYPSYLNLNMKTSLTKSTFLSVAKEAVGQASINQGQVSALLLPLPPLTEQHRIVTKVNQLLTLCDTLKSNLNQAQTTQAQLADAIVKQAVN